jgi:poly-gamma-glutamate capsule biosynthesis protein CapA/YwtB (metallophosphatase superfamily)
MTSPVRVLATGDAIVNRRISVLRDPDFTDLRQLLTAADAALSNFETTTPRPPLVPSPTHGLAISAPSFVIDELTWMGFNIFNLANNHSSVYGWQGFLDTLEEFRTRNLSFAGGGNTLAEARAPGYLDVSAGRVALVGVTVTNAAAVLAADPGRSTAGRPGASPLRHKLEYRLDDRRFDRLLDIDEAIGAAEARGDRLAFGPEAHESPPPATSGRVEFLGRIFLRDKVSGVRGRLHAGDIASLERSIKEARRQADVVLVSVHCHEGEAGNWNGDRPPDFLIEAAHRCIDAGADVIAGHGPHRLRGLEVYRGKPIFYSLGNFFLQLETVDPVPGEAFEEFGLPANSVPADYHDHVWQKPDGTPIGFAADPVWFESLIAQCDVEDGRLTELVLHPVELGRELPRPRRGVPRLVNADRGCEILERFAAISQPFGTELQIETAAGRSTARVRLER